MEKPHHITPAAGWQAMGSTTLPVYSVAAIRAAEQLAFAHLPSYSLMHTAGTQAASALLHWTQQNTWTKPLLFVVLAGPGNNGGDACVVAAALQSAQQTVRLVVISSISENAKPTDRQHALQEALDTGLHLYTLANAQQDWHQWQQTHAVCVVDGLLGIGATHSPSGAVGQALQWLHQVLPTHQLCSTSHQARHHAVVALDCPSGLNCDTGLSNTMGPQPVAADLTLCFIACKIGLLWGSGKDLCGQLWVHALGCEPWLEEHQNIQRPKYPDSTQYPTQCPADNTWQELRPQRYHAQHKGSFGSVAVLGGDQGMVGAAFLAGRTALMLGAGRVALSCKEQTFDPQYPELMFKPWEQNQIFASVWLLGPGLGQSPLAIQTVHQALQNWDSHQQHRQQQHNFAWVLDADALNILAHHPVPLPSWNPNQIVITPHPLEAARLLACTVADIDNDRLQAAQTLAERYQCTVVLKGTGTVVAQYTTTGYTAWVHNTGGPALATAGSGDVLAGAIAAFLAQGCSAWQAANAAVGLHGMAVAALPGHFPAAKVLNASAIAQRMQMHLNSSHR